MPIIKAKPNKVHFDERSHTYKINNSYLDSVTSWIGEYFCTPFKEGNKHIFMAHNKAKSNKNKGTGITDADKLQELWELNRKRAAATGTATHTYVEMLHLYRQYDDDLPPDTGYEEAAYKAYETIVKSWDIVELEKLVYSEDYRLAGHYDCAIKHKKTGVLGILDWKTVGDMHKTYHNFKEELSDFKETPLNKAAIQLTTYSILDSMKVLPENMYVVQLKPTGEFEIFGGKKNPLPDFRKQVMIALEKRVGTKVEENIFKYL